MQTNDSIKFDKDFFSPKFRIDSLVLTPIFLCFLALIWGLMYLALNLKFVSIIPFSYIVIIGSSLYYYRKEKKEERFIYIHLVTVLLLPFLVQIFLGGLENSGRIMIWGILAPIGAVLYLKNITAIIWFIIYLSFTIVLIVLDDYITLLAVQVDAWKSSMFLIMNLSASSIVVFLYIMYYVNAKNSETLKNLSLVNSLQSAKIELEDKNKMLFKSLDERNVLLKEIHHRVKNNMQIITSLLSLQANYVESESTKSLLRYSQYRIRSMALIHELLYDAKDLSNIDYSEYLKLLSSNLLTSMKGEKNNVEIEIDCPSIKLNIDTAIPLGLLINEVITNSLKYGILENSVGLIRIEIRYLHKGNFILNISDDGVGFPKNVNFRDSNSLGILLMHNLALQLNGNIEKLNTPGTNYCVTFQEIKHN